MPELSIVIPCYNSGHFLPDALESIHAYTGLHTYEVVIVDDGSTDAATLQYLNSCSNRSNYQVIHQPNAGPAAARNTGVVSATTDYILFLDSDNRIHANLFIDKGIAVLNAHPEVGVFYGNPSFFGEVTTERVFKTGAFDLEKLWPENYIDMCSLIRKATWQAVDGLDENRLLQHEDWDFWLRIGRTGWQFYYEETVLFDYRIVTGSMVMQSNTSKDYDKMVCYIYQKHSDILPQHLKEWCASVELQSDLV